MFRLEKKARLAAPAPAPTTPTTLTHITGPAAVHMLFIRIAFATTAREVLGMPPSDFASFDSSDVWDCFRASWRVVHHDNHANVNWIISNKLCDYAELAEDRLLWAKKAMWAELLADVEM
jgi:hypothetical protein